MAVYTNKELHNHMSHTQTQKNCSKKHTKSQFGEDLLILPLLLNVTLGQVGTFVEIGAWDGVHLSNTYMLERCFNWSTQKGDNVVDVHIVTSDGNAPLCKMDIFKIIQALWKWTRSKAVQSILSFTAISIGALFNTEDDCLSCDQIAQLGKYVEAHWRKALSQKEDDEESVEGAVIESDCEDEDGKDGKDGEEGEDGEEDCSVTKWLMDMPPRDDIREYARRTRQRVK